MAEGSIREFVVECGRRLDRSADDVEPYVKVLQDNWFDNPESLEDTKPEELANQGIPLRFAKELIRAAKDASRSSARRASSAVAKPKRDARVPVRFERENRSLVKPSREEDWALEPSQGFRDRVELWEADSGFNLRACVLGEKGKNVHHIQDQTGARLWLRGGEHGERFYFEISANNKQDLDQAVRLTKDLKHAVHEQYQGWRKPGRGGGEARSSTSWRESKEQPREDDVLLMEVDRQVSAASADPQQAKVRVGLPRAKTKAAAHPTSVQPKDHSSEAKGSSRSSSKGRGKGREEEIGRRRHSKEGQCKRILDLWECDHAFDIKRRVAGDGNRNVAHIQEQTGARIWIGGDPMGLEITADNNDALRKAAQMANDLLQSVWEAYQHWLREATASSSSTIPARSSAKGRIALPACGDDTPSGSTSSGKGRRREHREDEEVVRTLDIRKLHPGFRTRAALIGESGRNVHHIQDETGAKLWVAGGERGQVMRMEIRATGEEQAATAVQMAEDLITTVYHEYEEWLAQESAAERKSRGGRRSDPRDFVDERPTRYARVS